MVPGGADRSVSGRVRLTSDADESFELTDDDTVATPGPASRDCAASTRAAAAFELDDVVSGQRFGDMSLRWIYLHVIREFAHHCGHADILREQVLAARA